MLEGMRLKRRTIVFMIFILLFVFSISVFGVSPSQHLRSKFIVLSARLFQAVNGEVDSYNIGLLPMMDVNGDNSLLIQHLQKEMEEVISKYPSLYLIPSELVQGVWDELSKQNLSETELFRELGKNLEISALIMPSLITQNNNYTVNSLIVFTETGKKKGIESINLEKSVIDLLPLGEVETSEIPTLPSGTSTETDAEEKNDGESENQQEQSIIVKPVESDKSTENENVAKKPSEETEEITIPSVKEDKTEEEIYNSDKFNVSLNLVNQSPMMNNLLLGFDIGDVDGDGKFEVIYSAGMNIQVRELQNYAVLWIHENYLPLSNDHKLIAVDLDGDGRDEVIGHGNLLEVDRDNFISSQPHFLSRPVTLYGNDGVALFSNDSIYIVNYQGLVLKKYKLGEGYGKRFAFADLDGDGSEELITTMDGVDEGATIQVFKVDETLKDPIILSDPYGFAIHVMDLNYNGRPEVYLRRNVFKGEEFLYSKIYVLESKLGELELIYESPKLDYFVVDFSSYPKKNPTLLVVGGMYLKHKKQSINEIKSQLFYYNLK